MSARFQEVPSFLCPSILLSRPRPCHGPASRAAYRMEAPAAAHDAGATRAMDRTTDALTRQVMAMGSAVFEVGLYDPDAEARGEAVMIPRTWDIDTLLKSIKWLRFQNLEGRNIYIRPKGEHNLSLVDDLTAEAVRRMQSSGFNPAAVVETSPGNFQAWLKHPRVLPRELSTAAARTLAHDFGGDRGAADWRHFGRACGFANRKEKHRQKDGLFPFVRLRSASGQEYPAAEQFLAGVEERLRQLASTREEARRKATVHQPSPALRDIESFRQNPVYGGDGTRIDLAYAIYALSRGVPEAEVETAIRSRSLSHKGTERRQNEYVERTLRKAVLATNGELQPLSR